MREKIISQNYKDTNSDTEKWTAWELQNDLSTVSCYAAGEVDNLILERPNGFKAVKRLVEMIQNSLIGVGQSTSAEYMVDPATAVAMGQALKDSYRETGTSIDTLEKLISKATSVTKLLERATQNPNEVRKNNLEELKKLRSLCLALSENALAFEEPIEDTKPEVFV